MAINKNLRQLETLAGVFSERETEREKNISDVTKKITAAKARAEKARNEKEASADPAAWKKAASEERDALDELDFYEATKKKFDGPVYTEQERAQAARIIFDALSTLRKDYVAGFISAFDGIGEKYETAISGSQMVSALASRLDKLAGTTATFDAFTRIAAEDLTFSAISNLYQQYVNRIKNNELLKKP